MKTNDLNDNLCPVATVLSALNDKWTGLILRNLFLGKCKYNELHQGSNITHSTLSARLKMLEGNGLIEKSLYQTGPDRYEYHLTNRGQDLIWVILAMTQVGRKWNVYNENTSPLKIINQETGNQVRLAVLDEINNEEIDLMQLGITAE
ncbi:MAG: helix-turn-helix domain-containing protein [Neisseria sp.]|uniref:winged helix-turn-helix transcriptional regulator n=1 Tax=Neisseria sp. TaxID=192066 RepID=UPI0026DD8186|nr:helix-turn-helix domain-containing protein [Neisseria sp.]MDO4641260.1 helix-turn-helix domain-containing protein [Neisseria sp.]